MRPEPEMDELDRILGPASGPVGGQQTPAGLSQPATTERAPTGAPPAAQAIDKSSPYFDPCRRCGGSGRFRGFGATCFTCNGAGGWMRKTTREERAKSAASTARRAQSRAELSWGAFAEQYPDEAAWIMRNPKFEFATDLKAKIEKYGSATEGQLAAIHRCLQREAQHAEAKVAEKAQAAERAAAAPTVDVSGIEAAFEAARSEGLKRIGMRFDGFTISPAPAHGKNPGAIYVKGDGDTYLGKIVGGRFMASRTCDRQEEAAVIAAMADPLANAIAYGKRTGRCSCCGRELTDPESIAAGIGPICASNYGF